MRYKTVIFNDIIYVGAGFPRPLGQFEFGRGNLSPTIKEVQNENQREKKDCLASLDAREYFPFVYSGFESNGE